MMRAGHDQVAVAISTGIAKGLLPPSATPPAQNGRPWPVILLTALGAWLAAVPLMVVVYMLLGDLVNKNLGTYFVGALLLAGAVVVLRSREVSLFVEQLAVPALLVGATALSYGLMRDASTLIAGASLALLAISMAIAVPQQWLRVLLGGAAALATFIALNPEQLLNGSDPRHFAFWIAVHGALLIWVAALVAQHSDSVLRGSPQTAALLEPVSAGWLLLVLVGLCWWSGMTFLVEGSLGGSMQREFAGVRNAWGASAWNDAAQVTSAVMALAAAVLAVRAWPSLRQAGAVLAVVVIALSALSWFLPALGATLFALAWTATSQRWRLAAASAVAAAWIIGSFYYQLNWTLANKAVLMVALGTVIGGAAWWAARAKVTTEQPTATAEGKLARYLISIGVVLTLAVANYSIWQKETLIATGQKVFVELAPADPRSLMQGDFMRLNYRVWNNQAAQVIDRGLTAQRPYLVVRLNPLGVVQLIRTDQSDALLEGGEMKIELTPKGDGWMLVSDAWFFKEGDAQRWEAAKYGEFRVLPSGQSLLVGLADAQLKAITATP